MDNKRGIILKVTKKGLVVLGKDGLFYRLPLPAQIPLIGEEVELPSGVHEHAVPRKKRGLFIPARWRRWAMASSILLILVAGIILFPASPQAAYVVALDINPSLELYVDDKDRVIRAEALDREAEELLANLNVTDLPLAAAIEKITLEAKAKGLLADGESRVIATVVQWKEELAQEEIERKVEHQIASLVERDKVVVAFADKETLKQAHDRKLSVTRYKIAQALEEKGIPFAEDEIANAPVGELLKKFGLHPAEVLKDREPAPGKGSGNQKGTAGKGPGAGKPEPEAKEDKENKPEARKGISGRERKNGDQEDGKTWWTGFQAGNGEKKGWTDREKEEKDRGYRNRGEKDKDDDDENGSWKQRRRSGDDEDSGKREEWDKGEQRNRDEDWDKRKERDRDNWDGKREGERSGPQGRSGREKDDD